VSIKWNQLKSSTFFKFPTFLVLPDDIEADTPEILVEKREAYKGTGKEKKINISSPVVNVTQLTGNS